MINKFFYIIFPVIIISIILLFTDCYYDNEEELYKYVQAPCDTNVFTYSQKVEPILNTYCYGCHGQTSPSSGITLEGYTTLISYINTNKARFLGSINRTGSYSFMPQNANKLSDCNLTIINKWIAAGTPNN
jgi:hypothetical protein